MQGGLIEDVRRMDEPFPMPGSRVRSAARRLATDPGMDLENIPPAMPCGDPQQEHNLQTAGAMHSMYEGGPWADNGQNDSTQPHANAEPGREQLISSSHRAVGMAWPPSHEIPSKREHAHTLALEFLQDASPVNFVWQVFDGRFGPYKSMVGCKQDLQHHKLDIELHSEGRHTCPLLFRTECLYAQFLMSLSNQ